MAPHDHRQWLLEVRRGHDRPTVTELVENPGTFSTTCQTPLALCKPDLEARPWSSVALCLCRDTPGSVKVRSPEAFNRVDAFSATWDQWPQSRMRTIFRHWGMATRAPSLYTSMESKSSQEAFASGKYNGRSFILPWENESGAGTWRSAVFGDSAWEADRCHLQMSGLQSYPTVRAGTGSTQMEGTWGHLRRTQVCFWRHTSCLPQVLLECSASTATLALF